MHVTAIIAAGGEGRRLGAAVPKQLLEIGGRSILERSVIAFARHERVDDVIVVAAAGAGGGAAAWLMRPGRAAGGADRGRRSAAAGLGGERLRSR